MLSKENEIKMTCHNLIMMNVANMLNIIGKDLDNVYTLFKNGVEMVCGKIVSVLMFGNGTIEFALNDED